MYSVTKYGHPAKHAVLEGSHPIRSNYSHSPYIFQGGADILVALSPSEPPHHYKEKNNLVSYFIHKKLHYERMNLFFTDSIRTRTNIYKKNLSLRVWEKRDSSSMPRPVLLRHLKTLWSKRTCIIWSALSSTKIGDSAKKSFCDPGSPLHWLCFTF